MGFSFFAKKEKQLECSSESNEQNVLILENILIGQKSVTKKEAIEIAGKLLVDGGYVMPGYVTAMVEREEVLTTYIGEGIAIPHGVGTSRDLIIKSGISVLQFPNGVLFGEGKMAYLVIGIAGKGREHMQIITNIAEVIQNAEVLKELFTTSDKLKIYNALTNKS